MKQFAGMIFSTTQRCNADSWDIVWNGYNIHSPNITKLCCTNNRPVLHHLKKTANISWCHHYSHVVPPFPPPPPHGLRNNIWGEITEIPLWWYVTTQIIWVCFWLVETNKKLFPLWHDQSETLLRSAGSDTLSVKYSVFVAQNIILQGNQWWAVILLQIVMVSPSCDSSCEKQWVPVKI